uniref:Uncharacterized protein n=1 Tax=Junco hyemalis TaxID=40217 RepID=A0A8C5INC9_JUNHY
PSWADWHKAFLRFNHTNSSSVLPNLLHMEQKKALRFNNYSNPALELQEEIMASFYILIIVGFFGFLLFSCNGDFSAQLQNATQTHGEGGRSSMKNKPRTAPCALHLAAIHNTLKTPKSQFLTK